MTVVAIESLAQLKLLVEAGKPLVVDCYAVWCGPCKQLGPLLDQLAIQNSDVTFAKVDVDKVEGVAQHLQVSALPTVNFYTAGAVKSQVVGFKIPEIQKSIAEIKPARQ
jgi:thioredoxin